MQNIISIATVLTTGEGALGDIILDENDKLHTDFTNSSEGGIKLSNHIISRLMISLHSSTHIIKAGTFYVCRVSKEGLLIFKWCYKITRAG